jgi:hypothetical protein
MSETHRVIEHLDAAVAAAREEDMSVSEILGLLFYYAHNVAQDARESALRQQNDDREAVTSR